MGKKTKTRHGKSVTIFYDSSISSDCAVSNGQVAYANFMPGTLTLQASHNTSSLPLHAELAWRNVPETYGAQNRSRTHHQYETWFREAVKPCDRANHECNLKSWVNFDIFLQIRRNLEFAPSKLRNWSDVTIVSFIIIINVSRMIDFRMSYLLCRRKWKKNVVQCLKVHF